MPTGALITRDTGARALLIMGILVITALLALHLVDSNRTLLFGATPSATAQRSGIGGTPFALADRR